MAGIQGGYSPDYPSDVRTGPGIRVEKKGLTARFLLDYRGIQALDTVPSTGLVVVQDPETGTLTALDFADLPTSTPGPGSVDNTKFAASPPMTLKGNAAGTLAQPSDLGAAAIKTILGAGQPGGLATLDGNNLIPEAQLPPPGATATAGQVVGGQKVLIGTGGGVQHASGDTQSHFGKVVGISANAALAGAPVRYVASGAMTDPSFSFTEGPVYLGLSGNLTQTYPTIAGGFVFAQQVATATTATRIVIAIQPPVLLA